MHCFNQITGLLYSNKYKQFSTKNNNTYLFKKCLYDLTEICIEEKNKKYILSVPLLTDIHYKTSFTELDKLFTYLIPRGKSTHKHRIANTESLKINNNTY